MLDIRNNEPICGTATFYTITWHLDCRSHEGGPRTRRGERKVFIRLAAWDLGYDALSDTGTDFAAHAYERLKYTF